MCFLLFSKFVLCKEIANKQMDIKRFLGSLIFFKVTFANSLTLNLINLNLLLLFNCRFNSVTYFSNLLNWKNKFLLQSFFYFTIKFPSAFVANRIKSTKSAVLQRTIFIKIKLWSRFIKNKTCSVLNLSNRSKFFSKKMMIYLKIKGYFTRPDCRTIRSIP